MSATSLWSRILVLLAEGLDAVRRAFEARPATNSVAFSISFIALAAKLAKADGTVTREEVTMFRRIFEIPPNEEVNAARVYNLCRTETTGFESYARQLSGALEKSEYGDELRADVLDGLFHIAMADGEYHANENAFLERVSEIFGLSEELFGRIRARHVPEFNDPWAVVGVTPGASLAEIKAIRSRFMQDNHPDKLIARGLPQEMIVLANSRLSMFNEAYKVVEEATASRVHSTRRRR